MTLNDSNKYSEQLSLSLEFFVETFSASFLGGIDGIEWLFLSVALLFEIYPWGVPNWEGDGIH